MFVHSFVSFFLRYSSTGNGNSFFSLCLPKLKVRKIAKSLQLKVNPTCSEQIVRVNPVARSAQLDFFFFLGGGGVGSEEGHKRGSTCLRKRTHLLGLADLSGSGGAMILSYRRIVGIHTSKVCSIQARFTDDTVLCLFSW